MSGLLPGLGKDALIIQLRLLCPILNAVQCSHPTYQLPVWLEKQPPAADGSDSGVINESEPRPGISRLASLTSTATRPARHTLDARVELSYTVL